MRIMPTELMPGAGQIHVVFYSPLHQPQTEVVVHKLSEPNSMIDANLQDGSSRQCLLRPVNYTVYTRPLYSESTCKRLGQETRPPESWAKCSLDAPTPVVRWPGHHVDPLEYVSVDSAPLAAGYVWAKCI